MKKILIILIFIFCALNFAPVAKAQQITVPLPTSEITPSPIPTPTTVDYELPYPGILPTSPLYTLKLIRDGINDLLISDPLEKSNFYLEQSDKRLAAFIVLYQSGDEGLAISTLSKGLDYFDKSIEKIGEAKEEQRNVGDIYGRINNSSEKQKEEIEKIIEQKDVKNVEKVMESQRKILELEKKVKAFSP